MGVPEGTPKLTSLAVAPLGTAATAFVSAKIVNSLKLTGWSAMGASIVSGLLVVAVNGRVFSGETRAAANIGAMIGVLPQAYTLVTGAKIPYLSGLSEDVDFMNGLSDDDDGLDGLGEDDGDDF